MKNKIVVFVVMLFTSTLMAQSPFDKFEEDSEITNIVVNKKMFQLMSKIETKDKETQQYVNLIKKLDNLKVFVTQNSKKALELKNASDRYLKTANLEELMRVNEGGKNVRIYVKSGTTDTQIRELFMFIEGNGKEETVLMSLLGNFDLNEISVLTDKMNLPGGDSLKKAGKGKK